MIKFYIQAHNLMARNIVSQNWIFILLTDQEYYYVLNAKIFKLARNIKTKNCSCEIFIRSKMAQFLFVLLI